MLPQGIFKFSTAETVSGSFLRPSFQWYPLGPTPLVKYISSRAKYEAEGNLWVKTADLGTPESSHQPHMQYMRRGGAASFQGGGANSPSPL
jgi:hypothetical protein